MSRPRILVIAGSDSGGGAGFQADCKVTTALGGYASCALTALTAQNTLGVQGVFPVPAPFVAAQMRSVLDDIGADAIKSGMLANTAVIEAVAAELRRFFAASSRPVPYVLDPVMVAKGGAQLLLPDAIAALRAQLFPLADVLTPNLPEACALTGLPISTEADARRAAESLLASGPRAVLLKGGHAEGAILVDILLTADGDIARFPSSRLPTRHTHGTGCSLASALACLLARGLPLPQATEGALSHVRRGIEQAPGFGSGHGPIEHAPETSATLRQ